MATEMRGAAIGASTYGLAACRGTVGSGDARGTGAKESARGWRRQPLGFVRARRFLGLGFVSLVVSVWPGCIFWAERREACVTLLPAEEGKPPAFELGYPKPTCNESVSLDWLAVRLPGEAKIRWAIVPEDAGSIIDKIELGEIPPGYAEAGDRRCLSQRPLDITVYTAGGKGHMTLTE